MASIILELQHGAIDRATPLSELLRKAYLVTKKLQLSDFEGWIVQEMNGYSSSSEIPEYRYVNGFVKALNPVRGWIPVQFPDAKQVERLSRMPMMQSAAELEAVVTGSSREGSVMLSYSPQIEHLFLRDTPLAGLALQVPSTRVIGILDAVRNVILKWALQLEADGITGDGLAFSREEKVMAAQHNYSTNNFYGDVGSAQIQQNSPNAVQAGRDVGLRLDEIARALDVLRQARVEMGSSPEGAELEADIRTIEAQVESPKPKPSIVREALGSARRILEGAAGRAVGGAVSEQVGNINWNAIV